MIKIRQLLTIVLVTHIAIAHALEPFTAVTGSPFTTGSGPSNVAFSPITTAGKLFAGLSNLQDDTVSIFEVDQDTGVFTAVSGSPFAAGDQPAAISFSPITQSGQLFVAVANQTSNTISMYEVDQNTGFLTPVSGSPYTVSGSNPHPEDIAFSPITSSNELFLATTNFNVGTVSMYSVNQTTGVLTQVAGSPFSVGSTQHERLAFSPLTSSNQLLLGLSKQRTTGNNVLVLTVDQTTGALSNQHTYNSLSNAADFAFSPIASGNLFAAVPIDYDGTIHMYTVDQSAPPSGGTLTATYGSPWPIGTGPTATAFSPLIDNTLFLAFPEQGALAIYTVDQTTGTLTQAPGSPLSVPTLINNNGVAFSPVTSSNTMFVAMNAQGTNRVYVYLISPVPTPPYPADITSTIQGSRLKNVFLLQTDFINYITWTTPYGVTSPVLYQIYRDSALTQLVATIPATDPLEYYDHDRNPCKTYTYYLTVTDENGDQFSIGNITI